MLRTTLAAAAALAAFASAQTFTTCDPLTSTCPDDAALGTTFSTTFNQSMTAMDTSLWNVTSGASLISFGKDGAALALRKTNDTVTVVSQFYIFFGVMEIIFQAAAGQGIISTAILLSDDLDEIDWEFVGSSTTNVSNNWYGHGNKDQRNAQYPLLDNGANSMHNYTVDWNAERLQYILDGNVVRTVNAADSGNYPQTPCFMSFGIWPAGDSYNNGTRDWSGGHVDWTKGPYVMTVKSIRLVDGTSNSSSYSYGDRTGAYGSIKTTTGQSKAYQYINKLSTVQSAAKSWNGLSTGAKIGIACGVAGGLALAMIIWCAFCCVQRRKGREEKRLADKEWDDHQNELLQFRRMQQKGQFAVSHMSFGESDGRKF